MNVKAIDSKAISPVRKHPIKQFFKRFEILKYPKTLSYTLFLAIGLPIIASFGGCSKQPKPAAEGAFSQGQLLVPGIYFEQYGPAFPFTSESGPLGNDVAQQTAILYSVFVGADTLFRGEKRLIKTDEGMVYSVLFKGFTPVPNGYEGVPFQGDFEVWKVGQDTSQVVKGK